MLWVLNLKLVIGSVQGICSHCFQHHLMRCHLMTVPWMMVQYSVVCAGLRRGGVRDEGDGAHGTQHL